jgi:hypothetical protein
MQNAKARVVYWTPARLGYLRAYIALAGLAVAAVTAILARLLR